MLALPELQSAFADALLGDDGDGEAASWSPSAGARASMVEIDRDAQRAKPLPARALTALIAGDGLAPEARLAIYRHHVTSSLTAVLVGAYPVVCRLVDPRFFAYAADVYVRANPPASPCLQEYGASFADFLRAFPPCRHLAYLPDVARLEWAMHSAFHAVDREPLDAARLADVPPHQLERVVLQLDPSISLLTSPWPVDHVWLANQENDRDAPVDLVAGDVRLEVRRADGVVGMRRLERGDFVLRSALAAGHALADATAAARAADTQCDVTAALRDVLAERIAVAFFVSDGQED